MVGTTDLTPYRYRLDAGMADVMPDDWVGHARMVAYEETRELDDEATTFAVELAHRLGAEKPATAETIGKKAAEKAREKFV